MKQDDRNRGVRLLWETPAEPTRGPKAALSKARVVEAAIEVADGEGIEALTMRRVAETLGFTTMSLYRHVPGKSEPLDLMVVSELGLEPEEIVAVVTTVGQFVAGVGRTMADRDELWEHLTPERVPMMTHIWNTGGYERPLDEFEFGLARVLDGLAVFIEAEDRPLVRRKACL